MTLKSETWQLAGWLYVRPSPQVIFVPSMLLKSRQNPQFAILSGAQPKDHNQPFYPPIKTVGAPGGSIAPPDAVRSAILAAGSPPIKTVADPLMMTSAPHESLIRAAGSPAINTVGAPGGMIGVGIPDVAGLLIISVTLAAGNIFLIS